MISFPSAITLPPGRAIRSFSTISGLIACRSHRPPRLSEQNSSSELLLEPAGHVNIHHKPSKKRSDESTHPPSMIVPTDDHRSGNGSPRYSFVLPALWLSGIM